MIVGLEAPAAEKVAEGVDAPGDVVDEEDPHQTAPEQSGRGAGQRAVDQLSGSSVSNTVIAISGLSIIALAAGLVLDAPAVGGDMVEQLSAAA